MEEIEKYTKLLEVSKNIILTGAPGTGKTFLAKQIAKQLIDVQTDEELNASGQFAFVQFHPSYDYTDFVEGLRPTKPDINGNIGFELRDGVFKEFCKNALKNFKESQLTVEQLGAEKQILKNIHNFLDSAIENQTEFELLQKNKFTIIEYDESQIKVNIPNNQKANELELQKSEIKELILNKTNLDKVSDVKKFFGRTYNLQNDSYIFSIYNQESLIKTFNSETEVRKVEKKLFVFIIDEINRGEISKIFGELFFSIDPSYRGVTGALKTQYSNLHDDENEIFYVPENVYIIGSMNDIDRSVESFDFAMRRRFTWIEISAEQSALNMKLPDATKNKMVKLNHKISEIEGLNNSYHIGAAYFLDTNGNPRNDFDKIWELRIEPLLKEYLRGFPGRDEKLIDLKNAFEN